MRTLLIAALSLSAFTPSRDADACGGYVPEPRVLQLTARFEETNGINRGVTRNFAILGLATPSPSLKWRRLAPSSFDSTSIATDTVATPMTLTLIGNPGARVVTRKQRVFLSTQAFSEATSAIDVGNADGFFIALEGSHPKATWSPLEDLTSKKSTQAKAWLAALGVKPYSVYVSRVKGTPFETVSMWTDAGTKTVTYLRHGDRNLGRFDGSPIGAFTNNGVTQLVLVDGRTVSTAYLGT